MLVPGAHHKGNKIVALTHIRNPSGDLRGPQSDLTLPRPNAHHRLRRYNESILRADRIRGTRRVDAVDPCVRVLHID